MTRNWRIALVVACVLIIGLANMVFTGDFLWSRANEAETEAVPECNDPAHGHEHAVPEDLGPGDAPIRIRAYYEWATGNGDMAFRLLERAFKLYGSNLRIESIDTGTEEGKMARAAAGLGEDGLTINGRNEFSRIVSGELKTIRFVEAPYPYGSVWREVDLHGFIRKELERLELDASVSAKAIEETGNGQSFDLGNPDSAVKVTAYYPMPEECVDQTFLVLRDLAEDYKDRVYFKFIDTCSDDGFVEWCGAHTVCHGIIINGKQKCKVNVDGEEKDVTFFAPVDTQWTRRELEAALDAELELVGGAVPRSKGQGEGDG